jgi:hypothetical protein
MWRVCTLGYTLISLEVHYEQTVRLGSTSVSGLARPLEAQRLVRRHALAAGSFRTSPRACPPSLLHSPTGCSHYAQFRRADSVRGLVLKHTGARGGKEVPPITR